MAQLSLIGQGHNLSVSRAASFLEVPGTDLLPSPFRLLVNFSSLRLDCDLQLLAGCQQECGGRPLLLEPISILPTGSLHPAFQKRRVQSLPHSNSPDLRFSLLSLAGAEDSPLSSLQESPCIVVYNLSYIFEVPLPCNLTLSQGPRSRTWTYLKVESKLSDFHVIIHT